MKLLAEQDVTNNVLNRLQNDFKLKPNYYVTALTGYELTEINQPTCQTALHDSLEILQRDYHLPIDPQKHNKIEAGTFYIVVFNQDDKTKNRQIRLIFPYGAIISDILSGALVMDSKKQLSQSQVTYLLNQNKIETADDIALHELFKIYQPKKPSFKTVPEEIIKSIEYKGVKSDPFNLVTKFTVPLKDVYPPLQKLIKQQNKKDDYNNVSIANLEFVAYDEKSETVQFVTSLY